MPAKGSRKPESKRRIESVHIKLTEDEKAAILRAAERTTLDPSSWCRMILIGATDWEPPQR